MNAQMKSLYVCAGIRVDELGAALKKTASIIIAGLTDTSFSASVETEASKESIAIIKAVEHPQSTFPLLLRILG